jgi:DNA repair protein RadA
MQDKHLAGKCTTHYRTTGSAKLNSFLKVGIETQATTEITGEFGTGKSQICYTLCVTANLHPDKNGLEGNMIFIDTKNTFRAERIFQIAEHRAANDPDEEKRKTGLPVTVELARVRLGGRSAPT